MRAVDAQPSQRVVLELSKLKLRKREIKIWCENKHIQQFSRLMAFNSISASGEVPTEEKGSTQTERELSNAVLAIPFIHARCTRFGGCN
jgi:hypothetical protein